MKAFDVFCLSLFIAMPLSTTTLCAQDRKSEQPPLENSSMIGTKYTVAEDLGMYHFFSVIVGKSYLLEAFSTSATQFDAQHIYVFLVESKGGLEERTIVDELIFDRDTDDSFSYIPIYDRRSDSKREYFARYAFAGDSIVLKEIYEFDQDSKKIMTRQPIPGMKVELDDY